MQRAYVSRAGAGWSEWEVWSCAAPSTMAVRRAPPHRPAPAQPAHARSTALAYDAARKARLRERLLGGPTPAMMIEERAAALRHAAQGGLVAGPAKAKHAEAVLSLLKAGADPNRPDEQDGLTPLLKACSIGHVAAVRALLAANAALSCCCTFKVFLRDAFSQLRLLSNQGSLSFLLQRKVRQGKDSGGQTSKQAPWAAAW